MATNIRAMFLGGLVGGALAVVGLVLLLLTTDVLFGQRQTSSNAGPAPDMTELHERMHRVMDAMHGEGDSRRMHEAMGPKAEEMVDQCAVMMGMMQDMQGMMGDQGDVSMGSRMVQ